MNIAITGASGMLGTSLINCLNSKFNIFATSRDIGLIIKNVNWHCFDLSDLIELEVWLYKIKPDVLIHCAAIVNVDECELNQDFAYHLHVKTTEIISNYFKINNGHLIYISTDSVFDGTQKEPYSEKDTTNPLNVYSRTKLIGERPVLSLEKGTVLRTNIIGWSLKERISFSEWVLKSSIKKQPVKLFSDVFFSPIHVAALSEIIFRIIDRKIYGLFHVGSQDYISKYDFGLIMTRAFGCSSEYFKKTSVDDIGLKAKRPKNIFLSNNKITNILGQKLPYVADGIDSMKNQYIDGYVAKIKNRKVSKNFEFWKKND